MDEGIEGIDPNTGELIDPDGEANAPVNDHSLGVDGRTTDQSQLRAVADATGQTASQGQTTGGSQVSSLARTIGISMSNGSILNLSGFDIPQSASAGTSMKMSADASLGANGTSETAAVAPRSGADSAQARTSAPSSGSEFPPNDTDDSSSGMTTPSTDTETPPTETTPPSTESETPSTETNAPSQPEDIPTLEEVLEGIPAEERDKIQKLIDNPKPEGEDYTDEDMESLVAVANVTPDMTVEERKTLAEAFGWSRDCKYTVDELLNELEASTMSKLPTKKVAINDFLRNPVALSVFGQEALVDWKKGDDSIIKEEYYGDFANVGWELLDQGVDIAEFLNKLEDPNETDPSFFVELYPMVKDIPAKDKNNVAVTIELIKSNEELSAYFAHYLDVAMHGDVEIPPEDPNEEPGEEPGGTIPGMDIPITEDMLQALRLLLSMNGIDLSQVDWESIDWSKVDFSDPMSAAKEVLSQIMAQMAANGEGEAGGENGQGEQQQQDTRYFTTVILVYNQNVFENELKRDGLDPDAYVPLLEVEVGE